MLRSAGARPGTKKYQGYGDGVWDSRKTLERSKRLPSNSLFQAFRSWRRRTRDPAPHFTIRTPGKG